MKTALSALTALIALTCSGTSTLQAAGEFTYLELSNEIRITGHSDPTGHLVIPSHINGKPVVSIMPSAFWVDYKDNTTLTEVTLPETLQFIWSYAFAHCTALTSVTIPDSCTKIDDYAFMFCESLNTAHIGSGLITLGRGLFLWAPLTSVTVDPSNTALSSVDGVLFDKNQTKIILCPPAKSGTFTIPDGIATIDEYAFHSCADLTSVIIPNDVSSIGELAFYKSGITSITIPEGVTTIENATFKECSSLVSASLPSTLTTIATDAFRQSTIESIKIPASVTSIANGAFIFGYNLTHADFLGSAPTMGSSVFDHTPAGFKVRYIPGAAGFTSPTWEGYPAEELSGFLYTDLGTEIRIDGHATPTGDLIIPSEIEGKPVTSINAYAFTGNPGLASMELPSSLQSVGESAFYACVGLTSVSFGDALTTIGENAFGSCTGLTSLILPDNLASIGDGAFFQCLGLVSTILPDSLETIGARAFQQCEALGDITIPASVTDIGSDAFAYCLGLTKAAFQGDAPSMGTGVFDGTDPGFSIYYHHSSTGFTSPTWLGYQAQVISVYLYTTANGKTTVTGHTNPASILNVPARLGGKPVTGIAAYAFSGTANLTTVKFPTSVTSLAKGSFANCPKLKKATFTGNAPTMAAAVFQNPAPGFKVYYYDHKKGFSWPKWKGYKSQPMGREIAVFQPSTKSLTDNKTTKNLGKVKVKKSGKAMVFTIKNIGTAKLSKLATVASGSQKKDFIVTKPKKSALSPGQSTTFKVTFKPKKKGKRSAKLLLKSNDSNENPFNIKLTGTGK